MSTEKVSIIMKLSKLFRMHSKDATLFTSLFQASIIPLINDIVQHDNKYITQMLFKLCKNDLLSSKSIQSSLDIAHELIKNHNDKNKNKDLENNKNTNNENDIIHSVSNIENKPTVEKSILCVDDITQIPVNVLSNVFTFIPMKELLTSMQFVCHQFIYSIRQPLIIHSVSHWLSGKIISFMTSKNKEPKDTNTPTNAEIFDIQPLPLFYKLSQSVSHLSLQFNHSEDVFTDLMLFKMNFIPKLKQLKSIHICDCSLWNHQPPSSNNITETLQYIYQKNKSNFNLIHLTNIRVDYALFKYISVNFINLKQLKIITQPRSIFKNVLFNHDNLDIELLTNVRDIYCELIPAKSNYYVIGQNAQKQYIELCKLRISKFLQFIIHKKVKKLELHIKSLEFLNGIFSYNTNMFGQRLNLLNDLTLSMHENIKCYKWCEKILNVTGTLKYFHLICENFDDKLIGDNTAEKIFINLFKVLWNKNKCIDMCKFTMKWNTKITNHGYCELFKYYQQFWKQIINENHFGNKLFRFEIYIDCANTVTIQLLNQLIEFAKMIKKYNNLSLVLQIGCFDDGINKYLKSKQTELSLFHRLDLVPSDYLSKTVIRAQM